MGLVAVFAVFALFVFMLSLLCFCVLPFSSVNKDLYKHASGSQKAASTSFDDRRHLVDVGSTA